MEPRLAAILSVIFFVCIFVFMGVFIAIPDDDWTRRYKILAPLSAIFLLAGAAIFRFG